MVKGALEDHSDFTREETDPVTLHRLSIFVAIAKSLSFSKAAKELHISQPSASMQLKLLEKELGARFFIRKKRGIELTKEGGNLLERAKSILLQLDELKYQFRRKTTEDEIKTLSIGGTNSPAVSILPLILSKFKKTHPQVQLSLRTDVSHVLEELILNSEIELAVVTNPSYSSSIVYEFYRKERVLTVVSKDHELAEKKKLTLSELSGKPFVVKKGKGPLSSRTEQYLKKMKERGFELNPVIYCETMETLKAVVKAGMGIGILYAEIAEPDIRQGHLRVIRVPMLNRIINTFVIYHKERPLSPVAKEFLTLMRRSKPKMH